MVLGATRTSNPLSRSAKPGGGSIPLAPSIFFFSVKSGVARPMGIDLAYVMLHMTHLRPGEEMPGILHKGAEHNFNTGNYQYVQAFARQKFVSYSNFLAAK